ncbi:putative 37S ribosomal protein [Lasiosphaeria ovina]|uniref:37S ribosomal protein S25, mitochondrial n=1 Tax=Lasiosphaeria ovina TaxID=92902 RepID=A0AAE0K911_9PEZI|nr:putative 37S ribosomal protein [Lasiosphaeria ovina]
MGRNFRAARVYETVRDFLETDVVKRAAGQRARKPPAWFSAVQMIPPTELLTRPHPIQHSPPDTNARRPHNVYRPTKIVYPEDQMRYQFYKDHPWELARPKLLLEHDGKDGRHRDWSKGLRQPGMALSGESVVQRQLWLLENTPGMSVAEAYDAARHEFYKLRQQEDIARRIAVEEARYVGAYFGKGPIQVSMINEDKAYDEWRVWAYGHIQKAAALREQGSAQVVDMPDVLDVDVGDEGAAAAEAPVIPQ